MFDGLYRHIPPIDGEFGICLYSCILSDMCSGIRSGILTFYLAVFLAIYLAFYLAIWSSVPGVLHSIWDSPQGSEQRKKSGEAPAETFTWQVGEEKRLT